jgi:hypothetical protein
MVWRGWRGGILREVHQNVQGSKGEGPTEPAKSTGTQPVILHRSYISNMQMTWSERSLTLIKLERDTRKYLNR